MPKRHFVLPDCQIRPDSPLDLVGWAGRAVAEYKPDTVVCIGDFYDFKSLGTHAEPGSLEREGQRYKADLEAGNKAFELFCAPIEAEQRRDKKWKPRKIFCLGNHENRADRAAQNDPKFFGHIGTQDLKLRDWERKEFLEVVTVDGVNYSHYFSNTHSGRPIGGSIPNKLNKIGASFVHGHIQGLDIGTKMTPLGKTLWGIQAGSCYLQVEPYRGNQNQRHWNGVVLLNDVIDGEFDPMTLSARYLCRKYEGRDLFDYMTRKYPFGSWGHLASQEPLRKAA